MALIAVSNFVEYRRWVGTFGLAHEVPTSFSFAVFIGCEVENVISMPFVGVSFNHPSGTSL